MTVEILEEVKEIAMQLVYNYEQGHKVDDRISDRELYSFAKKANYLIQAEIDRQKVTGVDSSDLISRKRAVYELGESTMPKRYRDFCVRVLKSEELTPSVHPNASQTKECCNCKGLSDSENASQTKEPCGWCDADDVLGRYNLASIMQSVPKNLRNFCPNCGQAIDWSEE